MRIIPLEGVGTLILGEPLKQPVAVWQDGIQCLTRFPEGACLVPLRSGHLQVRAGDKVLAEAHIDDAQVADAREGSLLVAGGDIHIWPFEADPSTAILAGEEPAKTAQRRIDLAEAGMPHRVMTLAVQVVVGKTIGPVRLLRYEPDPVACQVHVSYREGRLGPVTELRLVGEGLAAVAVEIIRDVRQTGVSHTGSYDLAPDDLLSFDDFLHGDQVQIVATPPFAIAGQDGEAMQSVRMRYHAVPEPRLERLGDGAPLTTPGGVEVLGTDKARAELAAIAPSEWTWRTEWPVAGAGDHDNLIEAMGAKLQGVHADLADAVSVFWWLGVIELEQDPQAAERLRDQQVAAAPGRINAADQAVRFLEDFPPHVFAELGGEGPATELTEFQTALGLERIAAADAIEIAARAKEALQEAVNQWSRALRDARLDWVDGCLPPLDDVDATDALAEQLLDDPAEGLAQLWERRTRIWQAIGGEAHDLVDVKARQGLVAYHSQRMHDALDDLSALLAPLGADLPGGEGTDLESLARRIAEALRQAEPARARLRDAPSTGSRLVETAATEGRERAREFQAILHVWSDAGVPAAVRTVAARMADRWDEQLLVRAEAWAALVEQWPRLERELEVLAQSDQEAARDADWLHQQLQQAFERKDLRVWREVQGTLAELEDELDNQRDAWATMIGRLASSTRQALLLDRLEPWADVRSRVRADAAALAERVERLASVPGRRRHTSDAEALRDAAAALEDASPSRCAAALRAYARLRESLAGDGQGDLDAGLRKRYEEAVALDVNRRLQKLIPTLDEAALAALVASADIPGAKDAAFVLAAKLSGALASGGTEGLPEAAAVAEEAGPWPRILERVKARLRPLRMELTRYMGTAGPRWAKLEDPEDAVRWLFCVAAGRPHEPTGTDLVVLAPGNKRLVEHTLRTHGLWFAPAKI